jgi:glycerophosphoryl diester phosphodiesterase
MTRVIAHRGYSAKYPEMSREAYVNAIPVSDGFECDLHLSSDLTLFCIHDDTLDRTTDLKGDVHEMTWAQISRAHPQPITFKEYMKIAMDADKDVLIETKHPQKFKGLLEKHLSKEIKELNPIIDMSFMSFDPRAVWRMRKLPGRKVMLLERKVFVPKFFADVVAPYWEIVTKEWVDQVHARGQEMYVWTVNDPEVAKKLSDWGVDTLISDNPELIKKTLGYP